MVARVAAGVLLRQRVRAALVLHLVAVCIECSEQTGGWAAAQRRMSGATPSSCGEVRAAARAAKPAHPFFSSFPCLSLLDEVGHACALRGNGWLRLAHALAADTAPGLRRRAGRGERVTTVRLNHTRTNTQRSPCRRATPQPSPARPPRMCRYAAGEGGGGGRSSEEGAAIRCLCRLPCIVRPRRHGEGRRSPGRGQSRRACP